ncbi:MAG: hypothetical protein ACYCYK_13650 [Candidatus Dormibacteria bacterium]
MLSRGLRPPLARELFAARADFGDLLPTFPQIRISELPVYHEHRPCKAPTAARVLELLDPLARTIVSHHGQVLTVAAPTLSPLQERLLTLLRVDLSAYGPLSSRPVNST